MKIFFICHNGYSLPGSRIRCYKFARELERHGAKTEVLSYRDHLNASYDGAETSKISSFEKLKLTIKALNLLSREDKSTIFYTQKAGFHALAPLLIHLFRGNRLILDYDDYEYQGRVRKWILRTVSRRSIFCVAASRNLQSFLKRFNDKTYYIPTGVDAENFRRQERQGRDGIVNFVWSGIVWNEKIFEDLSLIASAFSRLSSENKGAKLWIVGGGRYMESFRKFVQSEHSGIGVEFAGWIRPEDMPGYLSNMDVGLVPLMEKSDFNKSKSPTKLFEYMSMGLATISSRIGDIEDIIVDGENGFLADSQDDFFKKMKILTENRDLVRKMGDEARRTIEDRYSLSALGCKLYEMISGYGNYDG